MVCIHVIIISIIVVIIIRIDYSNSNTRDKNLYATANKCLQCLLKIMYTVL